jgi:hypothetical protein
MAAQCSYSISQPSICGPPSSPAWPWFGKADTYQSRSRPEQRREDPVRSGWHERRASTTDSPEDLITSAGYRQSADVFSTSSMRRILIAVVLRRRANFVVVFRWLPLPHCGHSRGCSGEQKSQLPDRLLRRVRHVVTEIAAYVDAASLYGKRPLQIRETPNRITRKLARRLPSKRSGARHLGRHCVGDPGVPGARLTGPASEAAPWPWSQPTPQRGTSTEITGPDRRGSGRAGRAFVAAASDGPKVLWRSEGGRGQTRTHS